ncbi:MAG: hypothetical protein WDM86_09190 [Rhizomicrobium sp.]
MSLVVARDVVLDALVAGAADKRISLARRTSDQDYSVAVFFSDFIESPVQLRNLLRVSKFEMERLAAGGRPLFRIQLLPVRFAIESAIQKLIVFGWKAPSNCLRKLLSSRVLCACSSFSTDRTME